MSELQFRHRGVRDLAWACFSAPLIHGSALPRPVVDCLPPLTADRLRYLRKLDEAPGDLEEYLGRDRLTRLGAYYERLWQFFLERDPAVELVAHNVPVRDAGRTVGEFDCLYYCHQRRRHCHLELAVKFYLGHRDYWVGPDPRDRLDIKLQRLSVHQLQLGRQPAARAVLAGLGIDALPVPELALRGGLFAGTATDRTPTPAGYNPHVATGDWIRAGQLGPYLDSRGDAAYRLLPRMDWLAPLAPGDQDLASTDSDGLIETLAEHFRHRGRPLMVAGLAVDGSQRSRFFVVDDSWPG